MNLPKAALYFLMLSLVASLAVNAFCLVRVNSLSSNVLEYEQMAAQSANEAKSAESATKQSAIEAEIAEANARESALSANRAEEAAQQSAQQAEVYEGQAKQSAN